MSTFSPYETIHNSIEEMYALTADSRVAVTVQLFEGKYTSALFKKGLTTVKIEQANGGMAICVSPPGPFKCILNDPDSTRKTELKYGAGAIPAHVCPRNDYSDTPARIVFHVGEDHAANAKLIVARIADRF